jgi:hypothetical protein
VVGGDSSLAAETRMSAELLIVVASSIVTYIWLTGVAAPLLAVVGRVFHQPHAGTWIASSLAVCGVCYWTLLAAAVMFLLSVLSAPAALAVLSGPSRQFGVRAGVAVWLWRALAFGLPRFSPPVESAAALSFVALVRSDDVVLDRLQKAYCAHVVKAPGPALIRWSGVLAGHRVRSARGQGVA